MESTIQAQTRKFFGKQNKKLREQGMLPAIVYGRGKESLALEISKKEFETIFRQAGENTLINLQIEGMGEKKVLIHDVARHYMKGIPIHVDFYEVDLTRKIHAKIPLHFIGAAPVVKELGGVLIKNLTELEVEALPSDLPPFIEVGIDNLKNFEDLVRVSDLKLHSAVKLLTRVEEVVVSVQAPRTEEELAELEKPAAETEKAVIAEMTKEAEAAKKEETVQEEESKPKEKKEPAPEKKL